MRCGGGVALACLLIALALSGCTTGPQANPLRADTPPTYHSGDHWTENVDFFGSSAERTVEVGGRQCVDAGCFYTMKFGSGDSERTDTSDLSTFTDEGYKSAGVPFPMPPVGQSVVLRGVTYAVTAIEEVHVGGESFQAFNFTFTYQSNDPKSNGTVSGYHVYDPETGLILRKSMRVPSIYGPIQVDSFIVSVGTRHGG